MRNSPVNKDKKLQSEANDEPSNGTKRKSIFPTINHLATVVNKMNDQEKQASG
jgi:hypothetical protein